MSFCSFRSGDAEILLPAEVNLFKNLADAGDSLIYLSPRDFLVYLVRQASKPVIVSGHKKKNKIITGKMKTFAVWI